MKAIAVFNSYEYNIRGTIKFFQEAYNEPTIIRFDISNLHPFGKFGCHVHSYGDMSHGCDSACDHFNPFGKKHGCQLYHGHNRHAGDLCNNIKSDRHGNCKFSYEDSMVSLFPGSVASIIGRMVVLHASEDDNGTLRNYDYGSATTGNAGARIACAVIGLSKN